jgi:hypothetical protein
MEVIRKTYRILDGKPEENSLGNRSTDERIILR